MRNNVLIISRELRVNSIFSRASIRKYQSNPVEAEKVDKLLRAGFAAPSAGNQQPWEFYVVTNKMKIQELSNFSPHAQCLADAPLAIIPCYHIKGNFHDEYVLQDMSACSENILLEATELGLGAVWLGAAPHKERCDFVRKALDIPDDLNPFCLIACGYPAQTRRKRNRYCEEKIHYVE